MHARLTLSKARRRWWSGPGKGEVIVDNWGENRATASLKDQGLEAVVLDSRGPREYLGDRALQMLMRFAVIFFDSRDDCARFFFSSFFRWGMRMTSLREDLVYESVTTGIIGSHELYSSRRKGA